jgi:hypothetical protein
MPRRNFLFIPSRTTVPRRNQNAMNLEQECLRSTAKPKI